MQKTNSKRILHSRRAASAKVATDAVLLELRADLFK